MAESSAPAAARNPGTHRAVVELDRTDGERRRDPAEESAELGLAERVHLDLDRGAARLVAHQPGLRRNRARQRVEPVARRGARSRFEARAQTR